MLTIDDCIALSGLTEAEIDAIAEHEHLPEMLALELGCCLVRTAPGQRRIATCIREDIVDARMHGRQRHADELCAVLRHFLTAHPRPAGNARA